MKKPNNLEHQVLKLIGLGIRNTSSIFDALTEDVRPVSYDLFVEQLHGMIDRGIVTNDRQQWSFSINGFNELNHYEQLAKQSTAPVLTVAAAKAAPSKVHYDGSELRATCLRKGAYTFLACPSLVNGERVAHRTAHLALLGESA